MSWRVKCWSGNGNKNWLIRNAGSGICGCPFVMLHSMKEQATRTDETESPAGGCCGKRCSWRLPVLLGLVLVGLVIYGNSAKNPADKANNRDEPAGSSARPDGSAPSPRPQGDTVELAIDFGNGASRQFAALPWRAGMTVADLLAEARRFRPAVMFSQQGEGKSAFLVSIDRLANQPGTGGHWLYKVNGKQAEKSFGIQPLQPGDRVLWMFDQAE